MTISAGTYTVQYSGGSPDYTSWDAFEADIVDLTGQLIGEALRAEDVIDQTSFAGFTTTASFDLVLRAQPGSGAVHRGKPRTGHRIIDTAPSGFGTWTFSLDVMHWSVIDLELVQEGGGSSAPFRQTGTTDAVTGTVAVTNCLLYGDRIGDSLGGSSVFRQNGTWAHYDSITFTNCAAWAVGGAWTLQAAVTCYNCTAVRQSSDTNVAASGFRYVTAVNCLALHFGGLSSHFDFKDLGVGSSNNCSSDASGDAKTNLIVADELVEVSTYVWDFHLKAGSAVKSSGRHISTVTDDVDGDPRDNTSPSAGFDEYTAPIDVVRSNIQLPWTKKPRSFEVDFASPILEGLSSIHTWRTLHDNHGPDAVDDWNIVTGGTSSYDLNATTRYGSGLEMIGTGVGSSNNPYFNSESAGHERLVYTHMFVGVSQPRFSDVNVFMAIAEDPGSTTTDRTFYIDENDLLEFYCWDGAAVYVNSGVTINDYDAFAVVVSCVSDSHVTLTTKNLTTGQVGVVTDTVINTFYQAYATPELVYGFAENTDPGNASANTVNLVSAVTKIALSDDHALSFVNNPWQVFKSEDFPVFFPAALPTQFTLSSKVELPWTKKPPAGTPLDRSNPFVKDMFFFCAMDRHGNQINLVDGREGVLDTSGGGATVTRKGTLDGLALDFEHVTAEHNGFNFGNTGGSGAYEPTELTIISRQHWESQVDSGGGRIVSKRTSAGGNDDYAIYMGSNESEYRCRVNGTDGVLNPAGLGDLRNLLTETAVTINTVEKNNYLYFPNGEHAPVPVLGEAGATVNTDTGNLCIGFRDAEARGWDGVLHYVAMWNKAKSEAFIEAFLANPWQIYEPEQFPVFFEAGVAAPTPLVQTNIQLPAINISSRYVDHDTAGESKGMQFDNIPGLDDPGVPLTMSVWLKRITAVTGQQHLIWIDQTASDADDGGVRLYNNASDATIKFDIAVDDTPIPSVDDSQDFDIADGWVNFIVTWSGVTTEAPVMYRDGVATPAGIAGPPGSTRIAAPGSHSFGGRESNQFRGWGGLMAGAGRWTRVLSAGEIQALASGVHPLEFPLGLTLCPDLVSGKNMAPQQGVSHAANLRDISYVAPPPPKLKQPTLDFPIFFGAVEGGSPTATGAPSIPLITTSGAATVTRKATGAPSIPLLTSSGAATVTRKATGAPALPLLTSSGEAITGVTGDGAPSIILPVASGAATVIKTASGAPSLPLITSNGDATATPATTVVITSAGTAFAWNDGNSSIPIGGTGFV